MTAQEQATALYNEFIPWLERRQAEDHKRVIEILKAWGIRVGQA